MAEKKATKKAEKKVEKKTEKKAAKKVEKNVKAVEKKTANEAKKVEKKAEKKAEAKPAKMSAADLKFFEEMLIEKRRQLVVAQSESEKANAFQGQQHQSGDSGDSDSADSATDINNLETTLGLAAREGKYLVYLEEALQRIKKGTFGICKVCKKLIPRARLLAVPTATKCVNCKEETKKKEQENNRIEMARLFAEAQRKEMMKRSLER